MSSSIAYQQRQLLWSGVIVLISLLTYSGFLLVYQEVLLSLPLIIGAALLPIWALGLFDYKLRKQEHLIKSEAENTQGKIFDDAYEVVLLKRQLSLTRGPLLKVVFVWNTLVICSIPFLLWNPSPQMLEGVQGKTLAPTAFIAFLATLYFVTGRFLIGVTRNSPHDQLSCSLAGWLTYSSITLFTFSLSIFLIDSELSFSVPLLLGLSSAPLLILALEWPIRSISSYYGSGKSIHPPHCPILPLVEWKSAARKQINEDLQYQFGHDLSSGTRAMLWKMAFPLALFLGIVLLAGSCLVIVPQGHQGILLTWGKPSEEIATPGLHFHLPYPIGRHRLLDTGTLHRLHLDSKEGVEYPIWESPEHKDDLLMVVRSPKGREEEWPVEVLAINAELGYKWSSPYDALFRHADPVEALKQKALSLLTKRMRRVPRNEWWSTSRSTIEKELRQKLRLWSEENSMGIDLVFFSLPQLHPPSEVAKEYAESSKARFDRQTQILKAEAEAAKLEAKLKHDISRLITQAKSQGNILVQKAEARLKGLQGISKAAGVNPELFWDRKRLQVLADVSRDLRKILILREGSTQVQELDLESNFEMESFDLELKSRKLRK